METLLGVFIILFLIALVIGILWFMAWVCVMLAKKCDLDTTIAAIMGVLFGCYAIIVYFIVYLIRDSENKKKNNN